MGQTEREREREDGKKAFPSSLKKKLTRCERKIDNRSGKMIRQKGNFYEVLIAQKWLKMANNRWLVVKLMD